MWWTTGRYLHEVEGLREEAEDEVGRGEVEYEQVARRAHVRVGEHHVTDEAVAGRAERYQRREQHDQHHLPNTQTLTASSP